MDDPVLEVPTGGVQVMLEVKGSRATTTPYI